MAKLWELQRQFSSMELKQEKATTAPENPVGRRVINPAAMKRLKEERREADLDVGRNGPRRAVKAEIVFLKDAAGGEPLPIDARLGFGRHAGKLLSDLARTRGESSYLNWLSEQPWVQGDFRAALRNQLKNAL